MKHEFTAKCNSLSITYLETMPNVYHIHITTPIQWIMLRHFLRVNNITHTDLNGDGRSLIAF